MAEHDTPDARQHRRSGWYWVRWNRGGLWFPEEWFRGHDGQAFWVRGRARQPAAEVGFRIREMGEDKPEDNAVREGTPVDSDTLALRLARDVVSRYIDHTETHMELPRLENLVKDAIVVALIERDITVVRLEAQSIRLKQELRDKERETIERCAALAELEPELPGEMPEEAKSAAVTHLDPMMHFVPRATKRAIIRAVIRALHIGLDNPDKLDNLDKLDNPDK